MPRLFAYGSLQREEIQRSVVGHVLVGTPDSLVGVETSSVRIEDPKVVAATGRTHHANLRFVGGEDNCVAGVVFELDERQLAVVDEYESSFAYVRVAAPLASGGEAWVYVSSAPDDARHHAVTKQRSEDRNVTDRQAAAPVISKSRLEFLFDGVFAIAMTLLVLELKVPELSDRRSIAELSRALTHNAPTFVSYLLSFIVLGVFWYRHNQQYHHFKFITRSMLILHFVQLAAAGFFPFCAALLGRYPTNPLTLVVYCGCTLVYAAASLSNWIIARRHASLGPEMADAAFRRSRNRLVLWNAVIAALLAMYVLRVVAR